MVQIHTTVLLRIVLSAVVMTPIVAQKQSLSLQQMNKYTSNATETDSIGLSTAIFFVFEAVMVTAFASICIHAITCMQSNSNNNDSLRSFTRRKLGLLQVVVVTKSHRIIASASILGICFTVTHICTVVVTCISAGTDWGTGAWCFDMMGFFAGFMFAFICKKSSNTRASEFKKNNFWIWIWSLCTGMYVYMYVYMYLIE